MVLPTTNRKGARINRARLDVTYEWLAQKLGLPDDMRIIGVYDDLPRNILSFYVTSSDPLYDTPEGQECISIPNETIEEWANSSTFVCDLSYPTKYNQLGE